MVFKRIKSIEDLLDGTKIHITNVKTLEEIVCHTVSEEFYHRHLRLFNKPSISLFRFKSTGEK